MTPLLAEGIPVEGLAQTIRDLGLIGLLGLAVWVLWRRSERAQGLREAENAVALAKSQSVEKEYIEARARWTATIAAMAENDKAMAETQKELLDELRAVRQHLDDHEERCTGRRAGTAGGRDA